MRQIMLCTLLSATLPGVIEAQSNVNSPDSGKGPSGDIVTTTGDEGETTANFVSMASARRGQAYQPPTHQMLLSIYMFDVLGPYPIVSAAVTAGFNQKGNAPPEWGQGIQGYTERFLSNNGIGAARTTSRYLLAKSFREDTLYYGCECMAVMPRLGHAVLSSITGRRGEDGHRVFSIPSLVAPYAGTFAGIYGWSPRRYNAKDAFRMGNYGMLSYVGSNISLEFLFSGPHAILAKVHQSKGPNIPIKEPGQ